VNVPHHQLQNLYKNYCIYISGTLLHGVAELRDDSCGVGILPASEIQGTGKMPIPQNHKNHPANMQRLLHFVNNNLTLIPT
jgi:hypothetical protein